MRDHLLVNLNFCEIVNYGGQPPAQAQQNPPITCYGYCVSCEESGVLQQVGGQLSLMSHGCDSEDFKIVLGPMPPSQDPEVTRPIVKPVLFLLNDPGGGVQNGRVIPYRGFQKQPPVNIYYWAPDCEGWPDSPSQVVEGSNLYGPYFAYLMRRYQLRNVYITNRVKCKYRGENNRANQPRPIVEHCVKRLLTREVEFFDPQLAFCFGGKAMRTFQALVQSVIPNCRPVCLYHPGARLASAELIEENDRWIRGFLDEQNLT